MKKITMKEFQDKSNIEIIIEIMKKNKGYITSKELDMFHSFVPNVYTPQCLLSKPSKSLFIL